MKIKLFLIIFLSFISLMKSEEDISIMTKPKLPFSCKFGGFDYSILGNNKTGYSSTDSFGNVYYFNICNNTPKCNSNKNEKKYFIACQIKQGSIATIDSIDVIGGFQTGILNSVYLNYSSTNINNNNNIFENNFNNLIINFLPNINIIDNSQIISSVTIISKYTYSVTLSFNPNYYIDSNDIYNSYSSNSFKLFNNQFYLLILLLILLFI